jgi:Restriction endonuclease
MIEELIVGQLYSNDEIFRSLKVANAGGIRLSLQDDAVLRAVIMTSAQGFHSADENPYHDRLEGDTLTFTAAGKVGQKTLAGANNRIIEQKKFNFPIHGFLLIANRRDKSVGPKRWKYLGLLEYLRHYPDTQLDADGDVRKVWLFEFKIHREVEVLPIAIETAISNKLLVASRLQAANSLDDDEIVDGSDSQQTQDAGRIEQVRGKLLAMEPKNFEFFIKDLLVHCGFADVCVTKFTSDGGIDVNARVGGRLWISKIPWFRYKRSVGCILWDGKRLQNCVEACNHSLEARSLPGHFSKAAINEASEQGKNPIALVDGFRLSKVVLDEQFHLAV